MEILIIIFSVFFLLLAMSRLNWAILFIIATLPSYLIRFKVLGIPSTLLELMILIVGGVWLISYFLPHLKKILKNRRQRQAYPFSWEIILIILISFAAAGLASFSLSALGIWKAYFFEPILLFLIIFNVFRGPREWDKIFWALLASTVLVSGAAIYQKITGQFIINDFWAQAETRRVVSWFGYPNAVGLYLAPLIFILLGGLATRLQSFRAALQDWLKGLAITLAIIMAGLAIYFARSEGALIAIAISLAICGLAAGRKIRLATLLIILAVAIGIFSYGPARNYLITKATLSDLSGEIRQRQWTETGLTLRGLKFLTGNGLNGYQAAVQPYHQEGIFFNRDRLDNFDEQLRASADLRAKYWQPVEIYLYPHNFFLNFWSELGLLGALAFTWLALRQLFITLKLAVTYQRFKKPEKYVALGLMGAMLTILIHGLVDVPYFKNDLAIIFWLILALTGFETLKQKQEFGNGK